MTLTHNSRTVFFSTTSKAEINQKTQAMQALGVLLRYLRQPKDNGLSLEEKIMLRKKLPHLPDESEIESLSQQAFTEKILGIEIEGEARETLSYASLQRWEGGKSMPEPLNLLRIAKLAGMNIEQMYKYLFPGINLETPVPSPEGYFPCLLKQVKSLTDPRELGQIAIAATEILINIKTRLPSIEIPDKEEDRVDFTDIQRQRLAILVKKSLEINPKNQEMLEPFVNDILEAAPDVKYSKAYLEDLAIACYEILIWGKDDLLVNSSQTYQNRLPQLLQDLENKPSL